MPAAAALAAEYPHMFFVLDHLGCPYRRDEAGFEDWCKNIKVWREKERAGAEVSLSVTASYLLTSTACSSPDPRCSA